LSNTIGVLNGVTPWGNSENPGAKPVKLFDERGLFLLVTPAVGKWWRLKYRFDHKEKLLSLGTRR
jgi:hypothetical protein